mmetsp:Transcript_45277/g.150078  ORF Transcript_45277/g.150078 Transcript_45277/m.150078 type:complete len:320 (-) Transcript_45277:53-1012(-)
MCCARTFFSRSPASCLSGCTASSALWYAFLHADGSISWPSVIGFHEHGGAISCSDASSARKFFLSRCHCCTRAVTVFSRSCSRSRSASTFASRARCSCTLAAMAACFSASRLAASCSRDSGRPSGPVMLPARPTPGAAAGRPFPIPLSKSADPIPPSRSAPPPPIPPIRSPPRPPLPPPPDTSPRAGAAAGLPPFIQSSKSELDPALPPPLGVGAAIVGVRAGGAAMAKRSSIAEPPEPPIKSRLAAEPELAGVPPPPNKSIDGSCIGGGVTAACRAWGGAPPPPSKSPSSPNGSAAAGGGGGGGGRRACSGSDGSGGS